MHNKTAASLIIALASSSAYAIDDFVDTAQVISVKPIMERVAESRQECDNAAPPKQNSNFLAPIIGGLLGGLLGHQVGGGRGQTATTIVGAAGGAVAGNMVGNRYGARPAQQCRTIQSEREVPNGYDVVYRYNGRDVNVALPYDPGSTIKVGVGVVVDERAADAGRGPAPSRAQGSYRDNQRYAPRASGRLPAESRAQGPYGDTERYAPRDDDRYTPRAEAADSAVAPNATAYSYRY